MRADSGSPFSIAFFTLSFSDSCCFSDFFAIRLICLAVNLMLNSWFSTPPPMVQATSLKSKVPSTRGRVGLERAFVCQ